MLFRSPSLLSVFLNWFPMLLVVAVWIFIVRQMQAGGGKAMGFGKSRAKMLTERAGRVTFEDVAGVDEAGCGPLAGPVVAAAVVFPSGVPARTAALSISPVDKWGTRSNSTSFWHCVPLPAPGGPMRMMRMAFPPALRAGASRSSRGRRRRRQDF